MNLEKNNFTQLANFQPKQLLAWDTLMSPGCKYLLFGGALGPGKSYFLRWAALGVSLYLYEKYRIPKLPIGLFSKTYPLIRDRQISKIEREFPHWMGELKGTQLDGFGFYLRPEYGSGIILLRNLDDVSKYRSIEFAAEFVEELTENEEEDFEDLRLRLRYPPLADEDLKFAAATNPGNVGNEYVKRLWIDPPPEKEKQDGEQEKFHFVQAFLSDNRYHSPEYRKQIEAIKDPAKRKQLLEGDWNVLSGTFFKNWSPEKHTVTPFTPIDELPKFGGIDWGRVDNFCFLAGALQLVEYKNRFFHRMWIYKEIFGNQRTPRYWAQKIDNGVVVSQFTSIECDHQLLSMADDNSRILADDFYEVNQEFRGLLVKADKERIGGWQIMYNWFEIAPDGLPYLIISKSCTNIISDIPKLLHDKTVPDDVARSGPHYDAPDALRYLLKKVEWIDASLSVGYTGYINQGIDAAVGPNLNKALDLSEFQNAKEESVKDWKEAMSS